MCRRQQELAKRHALAIPKPSGAVVLLLCAIAFAWWMSNAQEAGNGDVTLHIRQTAVAPSGGRLRILTLNCWGLWIVAKKREQRIR